jgi:hypothetical protein
VLPGTERHRLLLKHASGFVQQAILLGADEQEILRVISQALAADQPASIRPHAGQPAAIRPAASG